MDVVYTHCAGLDVHKKTVVACCITPGLKGEKRIEVRTFGTMTVDLLALSDWLTSKQITHVAMESTGEFWKPIYNLLEGNFELLVVNAKHIKNVPGRKTDVKDAEWIAESVTSWLAPRQLHSAASPARPARLDAAAHQFGAGSGDGGQSLAEGSRVGQPQAEFGGDRCHRRLSPCDTRSDCAGSSRSGGVERTGQRPPA